MTYYRVEGYHSPLIHAPILHIEVDLQNPDHLIISLWNSLTIVDENFQEHPIVGQTETSGFRDGQGTAALFTWVTSFIQLSSQVLLAVDHYNHCIRAVNRVTNTTSTFAGICQNGGHNDQGLSQSRFYKPYGLLKDPKANNRFYVSDEYNNVIRKISGNTVSTASQPLNEPRGMAFDFMGENIYITIRHGLARFSLSNNHLHFLTQDTNGYTDGALASSKFSNPYGISRVTGNSFIVADYGNSVLRIVDTAYNRVSSICSGKKALAFYNQAIPCIK